ncbi:hypothetical protein EJ04DRAFT_511171 [Polyplosphaeria fusca]|uniref:Uncharacterized protein n=1 Tax=Polyplosphaeria fusca TaxID=682080 RepID=A0A9P4R0J0_9PLEO|nr:hypothetical protein EJ04DRAFT_511171 [Polyplosphaeria fusca]
MSSSRASAFLFERTSIESEIRPDIYTRVSGVLAVLSTVWVAVSAGLACARRKISATTSGPSHRTVRLDIGCCKAFRVCYGPLAWM